VLLLLLPPPPPSPPLLLLLQHEARPGQDCALHLMLGCPAAWP
jgi:hypothetical protein